MRQYVCIDIGGTSIKYGVLTEKLEILTKGNRATESKGGGAEIFKTIERIIAGYQNDYAVSGVAISTAGIVDPEEGSIIYSCDLMPHYTGTPLKKWVENTFNLPCTVENDVNCMGIAESMTGAGRGKKSCFCLTVGTGIGGCMVICDEVYHGFRNSACEVGYLRLPGGKTFQECAATSVLVKKVAQMRKINPAEIDGEIIFEQAKAGEKDCIIAIDELVEGLAEGIAGCVYILNPECVILGGGIAAQQDYLGPRIIKALDAKIIEAIGCQTNFAFAENGNDAGMIGALLNFQKRNA